MIRRLLAGGDIAGALAAQRLGPGPVAFFVLSAAAPLTVVAGTVATAYAVTGSLGLPVGFAMVGLLLGVFSVGYVAMSRHLPHAGAFYAYIAHGLGRPPGVGAAWVSLLAYDLIQVSLYGAIGAATSPLLHQGTGVDLPWWGYAMAAWGLVAVLGIVRVEVSGRVLAVLLVCEVALIIGYDLAWLAHPAGDLAWSTWSPTHLAGPAAGAILAIAVLGFVGFESAVVFAEEARHPRRTIPTATYLSVAVIAALYGVSAWAMTLAAGPDRIIEAARTDGTDLVFALAAARLGDTAVTAGHVLFATSITAAMISFHATTARYGYALGREGILPAVFGRTTPHGSPKAASLAQSAVGLAVIVAVAVTGTDPVVGLFYTASVAGALGILILLTLTALAVLLFFGPDRRGESIWATVLAPAAAIVGLALALTLVLANLATLLGVPESSPLRWGIPAGYALTALAGTGYGLLVRHRRPGVYAVIGHGAKAPLATRRPSTGPASLLPKIPTAADAWSNGHR